MKNDSVGAKVIVYGLALILLVCGAIYLARAIKMF